ncbi:MAG: prepilin-type N-terminal cleavage/methylation domain-containing protein [Roseimicrobium sp.]
MKSRNFSSRHPRERHGFTLIELLVVVAVIAILASLTLQGTRYAQESAARNRTTAAHAAIKSALEKYKEKFGEYPEPAQPTATSEISGSDFVSGGAEMLYQAITGDGTSAIKLGTSGSPMPSDGVYDETEIANAIDTNLPKAMISHTKDNKWMLIDGWNRPFQYSKGQADTINPSFDLWSFGSTSRGPTSADAKRDPATSGAWIKNW